jgi:glycosyltransferase involved in cell wall biosynthesis
MHSFSIIVVSYNTKKNFIKTLNSIKKQTYKKYEIIVIDGFSTDGTADLIRKNKNKKIRFLIEKDSGIYDAMNKGIKKIKNEWTLFLNSGDVFKDNRVLKRVNNNIDKKDDIVFGNTIINNTGLFYYNLSNFFNNLTLQMPFCHQSVFTRTELLKKNKFNLDYKICSDFDFYVNLYKKKKINFKKLKINISIIASGGLSDSSRFRVFYENYKILKKNKLLNGKLFLLLILFFNIIFTKLIKIVLPSIIIFKLLKIKYKNLMINQRYGQ